MLVGVHPDSAHLDLQLFPFHFRNLSLVSSYGGMASLGMDQAVRWLGQIELGMLISHRFPLVSMAEAFDVARAGKGLKVLVIPNEA